MKSTTKEEKVERAVKRVRIDVIKRLRDNGVSWRRIDKELGYPETLNGEGSRLEFLNHYFPNTGN